MDQSKQQDKQQGKQQDAQQNTQQQETRQQDRKRQTGRWKLFAVIAVCAAPMIASYLTYYVIKPQARTNYGTLIDPRDHPTPDLGSTSLDGAPASLDAYKGKWIMLYVGSGNCGADCKKRLYDIRQLRLTQGREKERIERVWLVTDKEPLESLIMREHDGLRILRAPADKVEAWLPAEAKASANQHLYLIDPLGNLMMRYAPDADPNKIKKDLSKLLRASSIG